MRTHVEDEDYLILQLPQDTSARWDQTSDPFCSIFNGGYYFECKILSEKQAQIVLREQQNLIIHGQISNFVNPQSIKAINNIEGKLYSRRNKLKVVSTNLQLYSFTPSEIGVELTSSSPVFGAKGVDLKIKLTPYTNMTAVGYIVVDIPEYYEGAGQDFMFMQSELDPCRNSLGYVTECAFNPRLLQLQLKYAFSSESDQKEVVTFSIGMFKNPIVSNKGGFFVEVLDADEYQIAKTPISQVLMNIVEPVSFKTRDFNYVDTPASGQYATHQFILTSSIPLQYGCRVKIIYPEDLKITSRLVSVQGTGFFQPELGQLTFTANVEENSVELVACMQNYGQVTFGILTLTQILNQPFVDDTETFKIYMTQQSDESFQSSYIKLEEGFIIREAQQRPGAMQGSIRASSNLVQTFSNLKIDMEPTFDLEEDSYMQIFIPKTLDFQGPSCTVSDQKGFSEYISCSRKDHLITLFNLFDEPFQANISEKLSLTIEEFLMPSAVQDIGTISVTTWDMREGQNKPIDQLDLTDLKSESGPILKMSEVEVSSLTTGETDQTYTFHYKLTHSVPPGGFFSFLLSQDEANGVKISNHDQVQNNCYLVRGTTDQRLECISGETEEGRYFVNITCAQQEGFWPAGTLKGEEFKFKIGGLTNPRTRNHRSYFELYTMDDEYRYIDRNFKDQQFYVVMTDLKPIQSVDIQPTDRTNGAETNYIVSVLPSTQVHNGDVLKIQFPPEISLPLTLTCESLSDKFVYTINCQKNGDGVVSILLERVSKQLNENANFQIALHGIRNPISKRPSSPFSGIVFINSANDKELTSYAKEIVVTNTKLGQIPRESAVIQQSSNKANAESNVKITFHTNNPLPPATTIKLEVPLGKENEIGGELKLDYDKCYIQVGGAKQEQAICQFGHQSIVYKDAFTDRTDNFEGKVELFFFSMNPKDNEKLSENPYTIKIFDNEDMRFGIDELDETIYPMLGCSYPCQECLPTDTSWCLACIPKDNTPQYLFAEPDGSSQTCKDACPLGFTSNGTMDPQRCLPCADTCETCEQQDLPGDIAMCLTCKNEFPFYWVDEYSCNSNECPPGTYEEVTSTCRTCDDTCLLCSDALTCTKCDAYNENYQYLFQGQCMAQCKEGYTPIDNVCVKCNSPCATCNLGQVNSCLTCDNFEGKQLLYGTQCLEECPVNTTKQGNVCTPCGIGCASCDPIDPQICHSCSKGLARLNQKCMAECPWGYLKSEDGSVCESRTYPLDRTFIAFPILLTTAFFGLIIAASYFLTGRRSLFVSSLLAFIGPIEMAASFYQFLYAAREDRIYRPILIGSLYVFIAGVILNGVFVLIYNKQIKGSDVLFERWKTNNKCSSSFFLFIGASCCFSLYRLIFCKLFRLEIMTVEINKPIVLLNPVFILSSIRFIIFNIPLLIVDFIGTKHLDWGNQCYMTMVETMILSFLSLGLLIYEYRHRAELILREGYMPNLKEIDVVPAGGLGHIHPMPGDDEDRAHYDGATPYYDRMGMYTAKSIVPGAEPGIRDFSMPSPRTLKLRLEQFSSIIRTVQSNKGIFLNGNLDVLLDMASDKEKQALRRCKSQEDMRTMSQQLLLDGSEYNRVVYSSPWVDELDEQEKLRQIHEAILEEQNKKFNANTKENQYSDPEQNNVYADVHEPGQETPVADTTTQTDQIKDSDSIKMQAERMRHQLKDGVLEALMKKKKELDEKKKKRKKQFRRGKKSFYENQIDEEDDMDSEKSDKYAQNSVPTFFDGQHKDMLTMAMQVEKNQSLTSLWDLNASEQEKLQDMVDRMGGSHLNISNEPLLGLPGQQKGIELSRVSGDLDLTESEDNEHVLVKDPLAKEMAEKLKIENVKAWIQDSSDAVNIRNFNENDIMGNFERDWSGKIDEREFVLSRANYIDRDGNVVNDRGYLIDEHTGDIRSKYSFEVMFKNYQLVGTKDGLAVELPVPFRIERHNFNPHHCLGNFDYDENEKAILLRDKEGYLIDKNLRRVNNSGWLIDEEENIIDNKGNIKFIRAQLNERGELPKLYNYEGEEYRVKNIIGIFERSRYSKEIILCQHSTQKYMSCDLRGRKVNSQGYLIDDRGNIINRNGHVIWKSHELVYNEPPKIFPFTEFSLNWIKGHLDRDVTQNPKHDDEVDLDGRRINTMGYLIDHKENVIDAFTGNIVFRREVLEARYGMEAEIPYIFRSRKLLKPQMTDDIERELELQHQMSLKKSRKPVMLQNLDNDDEDSDFEDDEVIKELRKMGNKGRDNVFGMMKSGELGSIRDNLGRVIDNISPSHEQALLRDVSDRQLSQQPDAQSSPTKAQGQFKKRGSILRNPLGSQFQNRPQTGHASAHGRKLGQSASVTNFTQQNPTPANRYNKVGFNLDEQPANMGPQRAQSAFRSPHNRPVASQNFMKG